MKDPFIRNDFEDKDAISFYISKLFADIEYILNNGNIHMILNC